MDGVDIGTLGQYGVLGVIAILLLMYARNQTKRETDRADRLEAELRARSDDVADRVIPALLSATRAIEDSTELLRAMQRERELLAVRRRETDG